MIAQGGTQSLGLYDFKRQLDAFGGVDYFRESLAGGYLPNARVMLDDGGIVQNVSGSNNTNNPNSNMTGWEKKVSQIFVDSIVDLANIKNPKDGDVLVTRGHTEIGLGGGTFVFEALSSKSDNGGSWIASTTANGVWVLVSPLTFENFGVVNDRTVNQSSKIQACLDFAWENKIYEVSFEKPNTYAIGESIVFKAAKTSEITTYYDVSTKTSINFNGAMLKALNDNLILIKVHRDFITLINPKFESTKLKTTAVRVGLHNDTPYSSEYRRSASFFCIEGQVTGKGLWGGVEFCPTDTISDSSYGCYYHNLGSVVFRDVKHGLIFRESLTGDNQTTRTNVLSYKHNGGACSIVGLNVETLVISSFFAEALKDNSDTWAEASQRAIYLPEQAVGSTMKNHSIDITGSTEDVAKPIYCRATNCELDIISSHFSSGDPTALIGSINSGFGGIGNPSLCLNLNEWVFPYNSSRCAPVAIVPSSVGVPSLPSGMLEAFGTVSWQPISNSHSNEGVQLLTTTYPFPAMYARKTKGDTPNSTVFNTWVRFDKSTSILRTATLVDTNANTLTLAGELSFWGVTFTPQNGASLNSPTGGEFYGTIEWIPAIGSEGTQVAHGTYPNITKRRSLTGSTWTSWRTIVET